MTITADTLVPEQLWQAILPLLPPPPRRYGGRPRIDDRACLAGIIYQLRTGVPWRLLPTRQLAGVDPVSRTPREWAARPSKGGSGWHASTQPSSAVTRWHWYAAVTRPSPRSPESSASTGRRCASGSNRTASTRAKPRG